MPLLVHPSKYTAPGDWPNIWPFTINRKSTQSRDIDLWYPCNSNAPIANLSGLIDEPTSRIITADAYQVDFPLASGRTSIYPVTTDYCTSAWVFYPSGLATSYSYALYTIIIDYNNAYDSPNFLVYPDGHVTSLIHHTYDSVTSPAGVLRPNAWNHLAMTFHAIYYGNGVHKLFVNGRKVAEINNATSYQQYGIRNRIWIPNGYDKVVTRDVRFKQSNYGLYGQLWSEDDVLDQYENPFDLYAPIRRAVYFHPSVIIPSVLSRVAGLPVVGRITGTGVGTRPTIVARAGGAPAVGRIGAAATGTATALLRKVAGTPAVGRIPSTGTGTIQTGVAQVTGTAFVGGIDARPILEGFHSALGSILYPNTIERERLALFGPDASATLYSVTPGAGEAQLMTIESGWMARRIPTIESANDEGWRMEITQQSVDWVDITKVATVKIIGADRVPQFYRVLQVENAMKPGHVYLLRLEAIAQ